MNYAIRSSLYLLLLILNKASLQTTNIELDGVLARPKLTSKSKIERPLLSKVFQYIL